MRDGKQNGNRRCKRQMARSAAEVLPGKRHGRANRLPTMITALVVAPVRGWGAKGMASIAPPRWVWARRAQRTRRLRGQAAIVCLLKSRNGPFKDSSPRTRHMANHDAPFRSGVNWGAIAAGAALSEME